MQSDCLPCNYFRAYIEPDLKRKNDFKSASYVAYLEEQEEKFLHHQASKHKNRFRDVIGEISA